MDVREIVSPYASSSVPVARVDPITGCFTNIDDIRRDEYPMLQGTTYLDHGGTTLYAKSLVTAISHDLTANLFGNPHSGSSSSQLSSRRIDDARVQVLRFLNADPNLFDVVFVANATAAIKLVAEAFRDHADSFFYGYHVDSHTSLVGVRELADLGSQCLFDGEVDEWLSELKQHSYTHGQRTLFGYPGQSNLTGYRPPIDWCSRIYELRKHHDQQIYSLYDAAARLSTASLNFSDSVKAPDFTALSFYKIFGLPDLGALIVRKECSDTFNNRTFFGGGTVDMVISLGDRWRASKASSLHRRLEDGTVAFHSIIALGLAFSVHSHLFGSMKNISRHTIFLARRLREKLRSMKHSTGAPVCHIYGHAAADYSDFQGPTIAFNLLDAVGNWIGKTEVEKLASINNIQFRTGGLCNPGGIATLLKMSASELRSNFAAGQKCGDDNDILNGKPTGVIRATFGAMSSIVDVDKLIDFIKEFFVQDYQMPLSPPATPPPATKVFHVQSLSVFPIKSCAAFDVPQGVPWEIRDQGLAWDREWCLIHQGTDVVLSQKRYPKMAMIRPSIDLNRRVLNVQHDLDGGDIKSLEISLDSEYANKSLLQMCNAATDRSATVCGKIQEVQFSTSAVITDFFTKALEVPCTLARQQKASTASRIFFPQPVAPINIAPRHVDATTTESLKPVSLANESPILLISQSSVNSLNLSIQEKDCKAELVRAESFRGNIVIAQMPGEMEVPYIEDEWMSLQIGSDCANQFEVIGPCHRCQMVCVDQRNAKRRQEPFSTLAKTRRRDGKVWFGMHLSPVMRKSERKFEDARFIHVGDVVTARSW